MWCHWRGAQIRPEGGPKGFEPPAPSPVHSRGGCDPGKGRPAGVRIGVLLLLLRVGSFLCVIVGGLRGRRPGGPVRGCQVGKKEGGKTHIRGPLSHVVAAADMCVVFCNGTHQTKTGQGNPSYPNNPSWEKKSSENNVRFVRVCKKIEFAEVSLPLTRVPGARATPGARP